MKYKVIKTEEALKDIQKLDSQFIEDLDSDIELIEKEGLEFVIVKALNNKVFEVKSNRMRALFGFKENKLIIIAVVYLKKTQKCPQKLISKARKILDKWEK